MQLAYLFLTLTKFTGTIKPKDLVDRMKKEYDVYWNEDRKQKAENMGFSPTDISTLASIVEEETNKKKEKFYCCPWIIYIKPIEKGNSTTS
jgi:UPF0755 protein